MKGKNVVNAGSQPTVTLYQLARTSFYRATTPRIVNKGKRKEAIKRRAF